jgi:hypothetical protein
MTIKSAPSAGEPHINRREVLLGAIAFVGGAATLASCTRDELHDLDLHAGDLRFFDAGQMQLVSRVVDIVIPRTDTPGALDAGVHVFLDNLLADWAAKETREHYLAVLEGIDAAAVDAHDKRFGGCSNAQQERLIRAIDSDTFGPAPKLPGFRHLKELILAGYYTSEIGATVELQYELVPGRYIECAPLAEIGRAWAHA